MTNKQDFVLVHGAWQGAWCWEKVVPLLIAAGHEVHTLDLPGLGDDRTPIADVSLDSYVRAVTGLVNSVGRPVVLVGHSMGGAIISQVAEAVPDKVNALIFLTAFSLRDGETLLQYATADKESYVSQNIQINEEAGFVTVAENTLRDCFYGLSADEDADRAISRLRPQAMAPFTTAVNLSNENYGSVRSFYIECSDDRAISPAMQRRLRDNAPIVRSSVLRADHAPYYSCPEELTRTLISMALPD
ncbi:MAG: alpha/beta hydrolase [Gammaproteobacteria bacterium]|nr:MAG: alpha/beta hydrolase [Gammaproteobacteria bacterium]